MNEYYLNSDIVLLTLNVNRSVSALVHPFYRPCMDSGAMLENGGNMIKRLPYLIPLLFLAVLAVPLRASPPIGAVVQTWHYDPQANTVTIRIVNISEKDITAFNISITETFGDHSVNNHEKLVDMLAAVVLVQQIKGTPDEDRIRTQLGDGTLSAHQSRDRIFSYADGKVVADFHATIDVVAYADGSAEATNTAALARLREHRNAELHSYQKANQILKEVLADSAIQTPSEEATARLEKFLMVWKAQPHFDVDMEPGTIEAVVRDLKNAPRVAAAQRIGEAEFLQRYAAEKEQHISMLSAHAQLKTGSAQ